MKISKIGLRHVLSWPKLGLEPKFHDPGTFGGFGKRGQTDRHTRFMFYKYRYKKFLIINGSNNQSMINLTCCGPTSDTNVTRTNK